MPLTGDIEVQADQALWTSYNPASVHVMYSLRIAFCSFTAFLSNEEMRFCNCILGE
jgi:hypothetical protein